MSGDIFLLYLRTVFIYRVVGMTSTYILKLSILMSSPHNENSSKIINTHATFISWLNWSHNWLLLKIWYHPWRRYFRMLRRYFRHWKIYFMGQVAICYIIYILRQNRCQQMPLEVWMRILLCFGSGTRKYVCTIYIFLCNSLGMYAPRMFV
jgi:hypothetical protein